MIGKDYWIAGIILWWLLTRPDVLCIITGPSQMVLGSVGKSGVGSSFLPEKMNRHRGEIPGHPRSASNMTTWVNSQFPRPDFHRQVQRHYGLQDTGFPPTPDFPPRKDEPTPDFWIERSVSNYPKTGCDPRKIQDLRAFSDSYLVPHPRNFMSVLGR